MAPIGALKKIPKKIQLHSPFPVILKVYQPKFNSMENFVKCLGWLLGTVLITTLITHSEWLVYIIDRSHSLHF